MLNRSLIFSFTIAGFALTMPATAQAEALCRPAYEGTLCTEHSDENDAAVYQWRSPDQITNGDRRIR